MNRKQRTYTLGLAGFVGLSVLFTFSSAEARRGRRRGAAKVKVCTSCSKGSKTRIKRVRRRHLKRYLRRHADAYVVDTEVCGDGIDNDCNGVVDDACNPPVEEPCGNGVPDEGEECDDSNVENGDGCSSTCQIEQLCGNGIVEAGEECDGGDCCTEDCKVVSAGPGGSCWGASSLFFERGPDCGICVQDQCEPGFFAATTGQTYEERFHADPQAAELLQCAFDTQCISAQGIWRCYCGDNIDADECFSGDSGDEPQGPCREVFESVFGTDEPSEMAMRFDDIESSFATASIWVQYCYLPYCGQECGGIIDSPCGDGLVGEGEECDDGNTIGGDGCSATCTVEETHECGNSILEEPYETCDDGNTNDGDGCSEYCWQELPPKVCGNGIVEEGEECDGGECCNEDCTLQSSTQCEIPSVFARYGSVCEECVQQDCQPSEVFDRSYTEVFHEDSVALGVLSCVLDSGCLTNTTGILRCYCGDAELPECMSGNAETPPTGACKGEIEADLGTTDPNEVLNQLLTPLTSSGKVGIWAAECYSRRCYEACGG